MVGWHHRLNRRESEKTPRDSEGQGSLNTAVLTLGSQRVRHGLATEQQNSHSVCAQAEVTGFCFLFF